MATQACTHGHIVYACTQLACPFLVFPKRALSGASDGISRTRHAFLFRRNCVADLLGAVRTVECGDMMEFRELLSRYRSESLSEAEKGSKFERLMRVYLLALPKFQD